MRTIILATANQHKVEELRALLAGKSIQILSAAEVNFTEDIEETGATLEENALLKARRVHRATGLPALADDTGLEVDALHGAPGVRSARFAGEACSPADNRTLLLKMLNGVEQSKRTATFRCVLAFVDDNQDHLFEGACPGTITNEEHGAGGFGYDAIFQPEGETRTLAELSADEKNGISHRGRAVRKFWEFL